MQQKSIAIVTCLPFTGFLQIWNTWKMSGGGDVVRESPGTFLAGKFIFLLKVREKSGNFFVMLISIENVLLFLSIIENVCHRQ